jgi:DNA-directed RNA polymerase specialized sigma24 family protein
LADLSSPDELEELWDAECQSEIIRRALGSLRENTRTDARTIEMFELMALEQVEPTDVAARFDASLNDVYLAKHRCLKRMRPIVEALYSAYETSPPN